MTETPAPAFTSNPSDQPELVRSHGGEIRGSRAVSKSSIHEGRFGRLFRKLPACPEYLLDELAALANSMRAVAPTPSGWSPGTPAEERDNELIAAGYTYFGQFVDHDITFDPASSLQQQNDPDALVNFRSPRFDLDSVYGSGPADEPFQYEADRQRLLISPNTQGFPELPRNANGVAIIGDPRNDENSIVSQLHLSFLKLHNKFLDQVRSQAKLTDPKQQFAEAQRLTRWHYQWVLVHDFLLLLIGDELHKRLYDVDEETGLPEAKTKFYRARTSAYMPVEFSVAAYRFGHSQIRDSYALNAEIARPLFVPGTPTDQLVDLRSQVVPQSWQINWDFFFSRGSETAQLSLDIDTELSDSLFDLPGFSDDESSLALRNFRRGQAMALPSGQRVAHHLGEDVLTAEELRGEGNRHPLLEPTPLWFYILRESAVRTQGQRLGPTGARIVGEVLLGLLEQDPTSYYNVERAWQPDNQVIPPTGPDGRLTVGDLVRFANE